MYQIYPQNGINFHEKAIYMYLYKNTYSTERHKSQSSLQKKKTIVRLLHSVQNEILKVPFIAATWFQEFQFLQQTNTVIAYFLHFP